MDTFYWNTEFEHCNNNETMQDYLDNYLPECFDIIFQDGTYSEIKNKNSGQIFGVNASGNGDFYSHKVEFEFIH